MQYEDLVATVAASAGVHPSRVKKVLFALPDGLAALEEGDKVRTPLGVFRMTKRAPRKVLPPGSTEPVEVEAELVVKLRAGTRLRRQP